MDQNIEISYYNSPVGEMILGTFMGEVVLADWRYRARRDQVDYRIKKVLNSDFLIQENSLHQEVKSQLEAYFSGGLRKFDLPLRFVGTSFQNEVWNELMKIPFGESKTYLELSRLLGNEKAIRAVASANGANAISIIVPCHRVIGSDGSLTGYAGGLKAKEKLLRIEGIYPGNQLGLFE
ncbi:MAG: methylated-DNA--[protein]-cysteine S-methyltransferase [Flavobacteriaceae bacterium]